MSFQEYLPDGITPDMLILALAGLAALITALAVWNTLLVRDPLGPRLKALAERRAALKAGITATPNRRRAKSKAKSVGLMRGVVKRFNLQRTKKSTSVVVRLARAGYRSKDAPIVYAFLKAILPFIFGAAAVLVMYVLKTWEMTSTYKLLVIAGSVGLGFFGPSFWVYNQTTKRQKELRKGLPDAIDLMVICAEAGLGMDAAFSRVAREMGKASPEIADEYGLTSVELSFLPDRRQALLNLSDRTGLKELRAIVNTLMQTEKYGTPLAGSLRVLSAEFRNDRLMRAEEKAAKLPALLTVPMIIFILPCLFIVLLGPAIFRIGDALERMTG
ncbi:MAG: type II secretion system F family protein [Alphaproteobacteria bacterium]|nr:type II secretion system F family protein [Alphaproteobacteria bacterium]